MKRTGYPGYFAGGVEAVSSTGGVIMPPVMGAAAFIMAQLLGLPYYQVALTALMPAVLYYMGQFIQVDLRAAKDGLKGIEKANLPTLKQTFLEGWVYVLPIAVLVYALFALRLRAELAAVYSIVALMMVASILNYTGLELSFSRILTELGGGNLLLLAILTAIASSILGMGMPITATYLFLAVLAAPAMVKLGVPPIPAHLFVLYFGAYSFLTPPVAMAVYAAAGFIVPFIFIYKPQMVFMGEPVAIVLAIIDSILAVFCLAVGIEGFLRRPLALVERLLYLAASISFFIPGWGSRVIGLVLMISLLVYHYKFSAGAKMTDKKASI